MWTNAYSYEDIGEFLREARRARGITQVEMARKLGFSSVTLSALETGKNVSAIKVDRYLQQLGFRMVIVPKGADVKVTSFLLLTGNEAPQDAHTPDRRV